LEAVHTVLRVIMRHFHCRHKEVLGWDDICFFITGRWLTVDYGFKILVNSVGPVPSYIRCVDRGSLLRVDFP